jgi:hypothetical protein
VDVSLLAMLVRRALHWMTNTTATGKVDSNMIEN